MATVSGTFTAVGQSAVLDVPAVDEEITASLTGTWVATVRLERELSPHSNTWEVIRSDTGNYSIVIKQTRKNERYRFNTVAFTSGTVTFSVADAVLVLTEITDPNTGALLAHYDEDGFVVDGDFDVTGTFTPAGAVNVGGDLTVTGDIAVTGGDITSSSGAIAFGDENLSTTGTLAAGATTITGALSSTTTVSGVTGDFEVIEAGDASLGINGLDAAQGGALLSTGGTSSTAGNAGGAVTNVGGTPGSTGIGGAVGLTGGAGGSSSGTGGAANLTAGAGTAGDANGGNIVITPGALNGSGLDGSIRLVPLGSPVLMNTGTLVADSGGATGMTEAILLSRYHIKDPAAAINYQVPTGTEISAALPGTPAVGDSFEFILVNSGNTTGENITLTVDTGVTFAGGATANVLAPFADISTSIKHTQTWLVVNTGSNTWVFVAK